MRSLLRLTPQDPPDASPRPRRPCTKRGTHSPVAVSCRDAQSRSVRRDLVLRKCWKSCDSRHADQNHVRRSRRRSSSPHCERRTRFKILRTRTRSASNSATNRAQARGIPPSRRETKLGSGRPRPLVTFPGMGDWERRILPFRVDDLPLSLQHAIGVCTLRSNEMTASLSALGASDRRGR
jgi:hypothetical protein